MRSGAAFCPALVHSVARLGAGDLVPFTPGAPVAPTVRPPARAELRVDDGHLPLHADLFEHRPPEAVLAADTRRRALSALESWLVRRMLCRGTPKNYNRFFLDMLINLKKGDAVSRADDVIIATLRESDAPTSRWPDAMRCAGSSSAARFTTRSLPGLQWCFVRSSFGSV